MTSPPHTAPDITVMESRMVALYEAVLGELGLWEGDRLLDLGGGTGLFLQLARQRGATVAGIDGDHASLPFPDGSFDAVTAFQFAADPTGALREAGRVSRPGASIALAAWGRPDQCEAAAYVRALAALLPLPPRPFALSEPGALAALAARGGLMAGSRHEAPCVWSFPDEATLLRGLCATRLADAAAGAAGEDAVTGAVLAAVAPFRTSDGGYRLENVFHFIIAHP